MNKPNYLDGSIVNLMSSISGAFGTKHKYNPLKLLQPEELKNSKNIVLLVIDGLGYEYLTKKCKGSFLEKNTRGKITSVYPPTTGAAIPTFMTGLAPQQHALTGWFVNFKELGVVSIFFKFAPRAGGIPFSMFGINISNLLGLKGFDQTIKAKCYQVTQFADTDFSQALSTNSKMLAYEAGDMRGFFSLIKKAINLGKARKYIYAYWPDFDGVGHETGMKSKKTKDHFKKIDKKVKDLVKNLKGTNTALIITADHGLKDVTKRIFIEDHPKLKECLSTPICGDSRASYCYVRPSKVKQFEAYVKTKLSKYCYLYKSEDLVKQNFFGLYKPNLKLFDRIGDYVLISKEGNIIKDRILDQIDHNLVGHHSGLSDEELYVPLIVFKL